MSALAAVAGTVSAATSEIEPHRLLFGSATTLSYFDPQPSALITVNETFAANSGQFTVWQGTGTFAVTGGQGVITCPSGQTVYVQENAGSTVVPSVFLNVTVSSVTSTSSGEIRLSLFKDWNNYVEATFIFPKTLVLDIRVAGSFTSLASQTITLTPPFKLGFSLIGNSACTWYDTGSGWTYSRGADISTKIDMSVPANYSGWLGSFGAFLASGATWTANFDDFKIGSFGGAYMRDIRPVRNDDKTTYVDGGGKTYFLATVGDPRGQCDCGIFSFDPATNAIAQTGVLFGSRSSHYYADLAGSLIRYSSSHYKIFISSWGTAAPTSVLYGDSTGTDLLSGQQAVAVAALTLPYATVSYTSWYDPDVMWDSANSRWLMAYTNGIVFSTFVPCLAYNSNADPSAGSWTLIGADTSGSAAGYEGTTLSYANHAFFVMAGGQSGTGTTTQRIYDVAMSYVGNMNGTYTPGPANSNPPWPSLFYTGAYAYVLTFNGTIYTGISGTMGQPTIQRAGRYW